jgi:hypothetical protein
VFLAPYTQAFSFHRPRLVIGIACRSRHCRRAALERHDHRQPVTRAHKLRSASTNPNRKEVIVMEYRKPEIVAVAEATRAIEGMKPGGFVDNNHPALPPKSAGAYLSDE